MIEPQPAVDVSRLAEAIRIQITTGLPGPAGPPGPPGDGDGVMAAIVSETAPPPQAVEGVLWVQPSGTAPAPAAADSALVYQGSVITALLDGQPVGRSADGETIIVPIVAGAIPVMIAGKRYLIPIVEDE
jgi:hypothetical protein